MLRGKLLFPFSKDKKLYGVTPMKNPKMSQKFPFQEHKKLFFIALTAARQ